jgi:hypothetical protein
MKAPLLDSRHSSALFFSSVAYDFTSGYDLGVSEEHAESQSLGQGMKEVLTWKTFRVGRLQK